MKESEFIVGEKVCLKHELYVSNDDCESNIYHCIVEEVIRYDDDDSYKYKLSRKTRKINSNYLFREHDLFRESSFWKEYRKKIVEKIAICKFDITKWKEKLKKIEGN